MNSSALARQVYSMLRYIRARTQLALGKNYTAISEHCTALRQIRDHRQTGAHFESIRRMAKELCFVDGELVTITQNPFYRDFLRHSDSLRQRERFSQESLDNRVRLRSHRANSDSGRQGNLIILKAPSAQSSEKGVLLLKYNATFEALPAIFQLEKLAEHYRFVFEPSWSFNYIPALFLYFGKNIEGVVQSQHDEDFEFISKCQTCLQPVRLCASDWVDSRLFAPKHGQRTYDVVVVASWLKIKQHDVIFRAIAKLHPQLLKVALIGYPMDLTLEDIRAMAAQHGVLDQCDFYEKIPPEQVSAIVADSRVSVLFSKQEGNPKAPYEALFCNTPVILHRENVGLRQATINDQTGMFADNGDLAQTISHILSHQESFQPRDWAESHTGYLRATELLNSTIKQIAISKGEDWSTDIVPKVNRPNLRYANDEHLPSMSPAYEQLKQYLWPIS